MDETKKQALAVAVIEAFIRAGASTAELEAVAELRKVFVYKPDPYALYGLLPQEPETYPLHENILAVIRGEMVIGKVDAWEALSNKCRELERTNTHLERREYSRRTIEEVFSLEKSHGDYKKGRFTRIRNLLHEAKVLTIGGLIIKTEAELRSLGFGRKSLNTTKEILAGMGLHLGMELEE